MDKRGQIYILAAILIAVVIFIMSVQVNDYYSNPETEDFEDLSTTFTTEGSKLANSVIAQQLNLEESFRNFTVMFTSYSKAQNPDYGLIYALPYEGSVYVGNFLTNPIIVMWNYQGVYEYQELPGCFDTIKSTISFDGLSLSHEYDMNLIKSCSLVVNKPVEEVGINIDGVNYVFNIKKDTPELIVVSRENIGELSKVYYEGDLTETAAETSPYEEISQNAITCDYYGGKTNCRNNGCCWDWGRDEDNNKNNGCDNCCYGGSECVPCADTCSSLGYECWYQMVCGKSTYCGSCNNGKQCSNGKCVTPSCTPNCYNKECGDNGCGGSCGTCTSPKTCSGGKCVGGGAVLSVTYSNVCKNCGTRPSGVSASSVWYTYTSILKETSGNAGITITERQKCYSGEGYTPKCDPMKSEFTSGAQNYGTNYIPAGSQISANGAYWFCNNNVQGYTMTETFWGTDNNGNPVTSSYSMSYF